VRGRSLAVLAALLVVAAPAAAAEGSATGTLDSYRRAHAALERAAAALGGRDTLSGDGALVLTAEGTTSPSAELQGSQPGAHDLRPYRETLVVDLGTRRVSDEVRSERTDRSERWRRTLLGGDLNLTLDFVDGFALPLGEGAARGISAHLRRLPRFVVDDALAHPEALRWLGDAELDGCPHTALSVALGDGGSYTLYLDRATGLPSRIESLEASNVLGDTVRSWTFTGYRDHPTLGRVPTGQEVALGGRVQERLAYRSLERVPEVPAAAFAVPAELDRVPPDFRPPPHTVTRLADGVFLLENVAGLNMLFVELSDSILTVEAPRDSAITAAALEAARQAIPGKPIRYGVLTHYHEDHAGGARALVAAGATLVVSDGNVEYFRDQAHAARTLAPDALARNPREPRFEPVRDRWVLDDEARRVEVIEAGPFDHANEMLVVWLPEERILFQGDLFFRYSFLPFPPANYRHAMAGFLRWLDASGLEPRIVAGAHGDLQGHPEELEILRAQL